MVTGPLGVDICRAGRAGEFLRFEEAILLYLGPPPEHASPERERETGTLDGATETGVEPLTSL